jgi:hypothetical protein
MFYNLMMFASVCLTFAGALNIFTQYYPITSADFMLLIMFNVGFASMFKPKDFNGQDSQIQTTVSKS